jgi:hypothetical protein
MKRDDWDILLPAVSTTLLRKLEGAELQSTLSGKHRDGGFGPARKHVQHILGIRHGGLAYCLCSDMGERAGRALVIGVDPTFVS